MGKQSRRSADDRMVSASDLAIRRVARLPAGFYVRAGHPLLARSGVKGPDLVPYGIASVRVPEAVQVGLGALLGLQDGLRLPLAVECDDLSLLRALAMSTDTVIASTDAGSAADVQAGRLVRLSLPDLPPLFSDMAAVSLQGRSHAPMAQFALDFIDRLALAMVPG